MLHYNLLFAWLWIVAGFIAGMLLGFFFHKPDWLDGYNSWKRRLYRLGHISFFGLSIINLLFYFTASHLSWSGTMTDAASWGFLIGAAAMPFCCLMAAHLPSFRHLFAVPVVSLLVAGVITLVEVCRS